MKRMQRSPIWRVLSEGVGGGDGHPSFFSLRENNATKTRGFTMSKKSSRVSFEAIRSEVQNGRDRYPAPDGLVCTLTEHSGKVAQAMLEQPWHVVQREAMEENANTKRKNEEGDPALDLLRV